MWGGGWGDPSAVERHALYLLINGRPRPPCALNTRSLSRLLVPARASSAPPFTLSFSTSPGLEGERKKVSTCMHGCLCRRQRTEGPPQRLSSYTAHLPGPRLHNLQLGTEMCFSLRCYRLFRFAHGTNAFLFPTPIYPSTSITLIHIHISLFYICLPSRNASHIIGQPQASRRRCQSPTFGSER